jgi:hypothetical protein
MPIYPPNHFRPCPKTGMPPKKEKKPLKRSWKKSNHTEIYMEYFGYDKSDFIPCEVCKKEGVDVHHIEARGMGGTNKEDKIENLMALCRKCHTDLGDKKQFMAHLRKIHELRMKI